MEKSAVQSVVINIIKTYLPPIKEICLSHKIMDDLKISSDDTSFLILDIEKATKIKAPTKEWEKILTVEDIINLLQKYSGD